MSAPQYRTNALKVVMWDSAFALIPPILLIMTAPISIAGWGVRESAMVVAFSYAGLPQGDGLLVAALFGLATFTLGIVGGGVWMMGDRRRRAAK